MTNYSTRREQQRETLHINCFFRQRWTENFFCPVSFFLNKVSQFVSCVLCYSGECLTNQQRTTSSSSLLSTVFMFQSHQCCVRETSSQSSHVNFDFSLFSSLCFLLYFDFSQSFFVVSHMNWLHKKNIWSFSDLYKIMCICRDCIVLVFDSIFWSMCVNPKYFSLSFDFTYLITPLFTLWLLCSVEVKIHRRVSFWL